MNKKIYIENNKILKKTNFYFALITAGFLLIAAFYKFSLSDTESAKYAISQLFSGFAVYFSGAVNFFKMFLFTLFFIVFLAVLTQIFYLFYLFFSKKAKNISLIFNFILLFAQLFFDICLIIGSLYLLKNGSAKGLIRFETRKNIYFMQAVILSALMFFWAFFQIFYFIILVKDKNRETAKENYFFKNLNDEKKKTEMKIIKIITVIFCIVNIIYFLYPKLCLFESDSSVFLLFFIILFAVFSVPDAMIYTLVFIIYLLGLISSVRLFVFSKNNRTKIKPFYVYKYIICLLLQLFYSAGMLFFGIMFYENGKTRMLDGGISAPVYLPDYILLGSLLVFLTLSHIIGFLIYSFKLKKIQKNSLIY